MSQMSYTEITDPSMFPEVDPYSESSEVHDLDMRDVMKWGVKREYNRLGRRFQNAIAEHGLTRGYGYFSEWLDRTYVNPFNGDDATVYAMQEFRHDLNDGIIHEGTRYGARDLARMLHEHHEASHAEYTAENERRAAEKAAADAAYRAQFGAYVNPATGAKLTSTVVKNVLKKAAIEVRYDEKTTQRVEVEDENARGGIRIDNVEVLKVAIHPDVYETAELVMDEAGFLNLANSSQRTSGWLMVRAK